MSESSQPNDEAAELARSAEAAAAEPSGEPAGADEPAVGAEPVDTETEGDAATDADEAAEAEPPADPYAEFKAQLRMLPGEWYVVHSYAGYENRVKANIETRTQTLNMEDYIFQIEVPQHEVTEIKGGKRQKVNEKVLPGYILVRMELTDESWAAVRNTPGVTGFVG
ncbi:MAG: transcription termination/antitermination protein NusG, partial [Actinomadura rubrobrunea]|nr:transcription termination/antitermination protein NusG [Actinomadura rubrobrunea]